MPTRFPQTSPGAACERHRREIDEAIARVLGSGEYILGSEVTAFEDEFSAYLGIAHAIGVANGTDAIECALRACCIGRGDLVYTVSHTAVATVAAVERCGATPVFVDIDERTCTMDPDRLDEALRRQPGGTGAPRAVIPVHLYGCPADIEAIRVIASRHGLRVIEDCAQAHGVSVAGRSVGTWGDMATYSFYPTKNLGALGDGGMVVTSDAELAGRARALRQYGWNDQRVSMIPGMNSRLDEIQAAVLRVKLPHLDEETDQRRALAEIYTERLAPTGLTLPVAAAGARHVYHQYVIRTPRRDALRRHLAGEGIGTTIHYPVPVHRQPAYEGRLPHPPLPRTEAAAGEVLSLPMFPQLEPDAIGVVADSITRWLADGV